MKKRIIASALAVTALACSAGCSADINFPKFTSQQPTTTITNAEVTSALAEPSVRNYETGEYSCFDNTLFIGNSRIETVRALGLARNADIFAKVGLNIRTVYEDSMDSSGVPIIDEIRNGSYDKIVISFGDNETGWPYLDVFKNEYAEFINEIREMQPDAEIYLQKVFPISKVAENDTNNIKNGYSIENIEKINSIIDEIAESNGAIIIPVPDSFIDDEGYLPETAASDGIHFGKKYCLKWLEFVADFVEENK